MKIVIRLFKYLLVLLALAVVAGSIYEWRAAASDRTAFPPPGALFLVDGLELHLDCRGRGEPVVILEAGLNLGSTSWGLVHDELSEVTQICAYDRPGMDWSEATDEPVEAVTVANRLHGLLAAAGVSGPQIVLGMSAGGVFVREYYARFPEQVVGMVLVDSSHEQQGRRLPEISGRSRVNRMLSICSWFQPIGVVRMFELLGPIVNQHDLPPQMVVAQANTYQSHTCNSKLLESEGFQREVFDSKPPDSLGDLPLAVISQGKAPEANEAFGLTIEDAIKLAVVWDELQNELTALSAASQRHIARDSGHVIQLEQPQIVIDTVREMVLRLRS